MPADSVPTLDDGEFAYFRERIEKLAGISLKPAKFDLVRSRLRSRLAELGLADYGDYRRLIAGLPVNHPEWQAFINLLTTNKTDFFREPRHFDFLVGEVLPKFLRGGGKTFRVWSAAASTGEEAYTTAMILARHLPAGRDFRIVATDIDTDVLRAARNGVYPIAKKIEIPEDYGTSIDEGQGGARGWFRIKPHLKEKVSFQRGNLIEDALPEGGPFDFVLCRNVLIYFGRAAIERVAGKLHRATGPGGFLAIGHSESLQGIPHAWTPVGPSIFRKDGLE